MGGGLNLIPLLTRSPAYRKAGPRSWHRGQLAFRVLNAMSFDVKGEFYTLDTMNRFAAPLFACMASLAAMGQSRTLEQTIQSKTFHGERSLSIYLPEGYSDPDDSTARYSVLYLFDAQFKPYFTMVTSMIEYYEQSDMGVPLIVVGIHTEDRWNEFAPIPASEQNGEKEGSNQLHNFLVDEVFPLVDSSFRTTKLRIGVGHSLGGTFVVNEALHDFPIFQAVIAASPNLTMYDDQILATAGQFYAQHPDNHQFIFIRGGDMGEMENSFSHSTARLDSITKQYSLPEITWDFKILGGKNHMTTFIPTFDDGYRLLSAPLFMSSTGLLALANDTSNSIVEQIERFSARASRYTGEHVALSASTFDNYGYDLFQNEKYDAAHEVYERAAALLKTEIPSEKNKKLEVAINEGLKRTTMYKLSDEAQALAKAHRYKEAAKLYDQAFNIDLIRVTHPIRILSVPVFAQAGEQDHAFEQLDLLVHEIKLGGNDSFINDPLCAPLHKDKRWKKLMAGLEENMALYR